MTDNNWWIHVGNNHPRMVLQTWGNNPQQIAIAWAYAVRHWMKYRVPEIFNKIVHNVEQDYVPIFKYLYNLKRRTHIGDSKTMTVSNAWVAVSSSPDNQTTLVWFAQGQTWHLLGIISQHNDFK